MSIRIEQEIIGYQNNNEYLSDELKLLDLYIYLKLKEREHLYSDEHDDLQGLYMSLDEAMTILKDEKQIKTTKEIEEIVEQYYISEDYITKMRKQSEENNIFIPMNYIRKVFQLTPFEERCLIVCLAYELDRKYEKLFAFLQDDLNKKYVTIDLLLELICRTQEEKWYAKKFFRPHEKLMKYFLIAEDYQADFSSKLNRKVVLDERIVHFLLETELSDPAISEVGEVFYPNEEIPSLMIDHTIQNKLRNFALNNIEEIPKLVFFISGKKGVGKKLQVKWFCKHFNYSLLLIDFEKMPNQMQAFKNQLKQIYREALLQQSVICFDHVESLFDESNSTEKVHVFFQHVNLFSGIVFLLSAKKLTYEIQEKLKEKIFIEVNMTIPNERERIKLWQEFSRNYPMSAEINFQQIGMMFEFSQGQIKNAIELANYMMKWHGEQSEIDIGHLLKASYEQVSNQLSTKSVRIQPVYQWDDLVLPDEQKELLKNACNQVKYRNVVYGDWGFGEKLSYGKGISMLFAGPPGTGKTMSAEVVANELKLDIYKIDLSQVVSKYIGETEKNLKEIFEQAQQTNAILFFDETDALFGKRSQVKDARDKYANIEVAYLLQKMEEHKGITILATNFLENIDEAFLRRISYVIHFPFPDVVQRGKIWRKMFPKQTPMNEDIDFAFLAEKIPVAGGNIKNIVLSAAFLAAELGERIGMRHLIKAAKQEMKKAGKILLPDDLEEYYDL